MYQSCLVYKFTCSGDLDNQYNRETERQLLVRTKEQVTLSNNAIFKHIENCAFCTNCNIYDCFKIIKKCTSYNNLLSTEAHLIKKLQPNLNNQLVPG